MRRSLVIIQVVAAAALSWVVLSPAIGNAAPHPSGPSITCNSTYANSTFGSVIVPKNGFCELIDTTVTGSVIANKGSEFETCDDTIVGSITGNGAYLNIDNDTSVGGAINDLSPGQRETGGERTCEGGPTTTIDGNAAPASTNKPADEYGLAGILCPYSVGGSINVQNGNRTSNEVVIGEDCFGNTNDIPTIAYDVTVGGSVVITDNKLPVFINDTHVKGSLICKRNSPPAQNDGDVQVDGSITGCWSDVS